MNNLNKYIKSNIESEDSDIIMMNNFRKNQYELIEDFFKLFIEYIGQQNNYYMKFSKIIIREKLDYFGLTNSQCTEVVVYIILESDNSEKEFIRLLMPTLLSEQMFYLNGCFYCPAIYTIDYPLVIKKESIKLSSLFNSITAYFKDDMVTFTGVNIPINYFISLFIDDDEDLMNKFKDLMEKKFKHNFEVPLLDNIIVYFSNKFNFSGSTKEELIHFINKIFFDRYTYNLYQTCYNETDLTKLIKKGINMYINNEFYNFVDLNYKRLIFMEFLLTPIIKRISYMAKRAWSGYIDDEIKIDERVLIKHFLKTRDVTKKQKGLSGNYLYNITNLYTGILQCKVGMVSPEVENEPRSIRTIHDSHFGKICTITISSQNPGRVVSFIPTTKLDVFGRFI